MVCREVIREVCREPIRDVGKSVGIGGGGGLSLNLAFFSPYNWFSDGTLPTDNNVKSGSTFAITNTPGAYFKCGFSGTSFGVSVDVTDINLAGVSSENYPAVEYQIDGGAWTRYQLASGDGLLELASALSAGNHTITLVFVGTIWNAADRWNTPVLALKITGFSLDFGGRILSGTKRPKRAIVFSDSHGEGYEVLDSGTTVANQNARLAWPHLLADYLDAEVGVVCFAGQGYTAAVATANVPDVEDAWDFYSDERSRLALLPTPDYIICGHGTNDSDNTALTTAATNLADIWAGLGTTFLLLPPNNAKRSRVLSAAANSEVLGVDTNTNYLVGGNVNGSHLSEDGQSAYASAVWGIVEPYLEVDNNLAIELVASTSKAGTATGGTTAAIDTSGADLLVACVAWYSATGTPPTVSDSKGNSWTKLDTASRLGGEGQNIAIWYSKPSSVGASHTLTVAGSGVYAAMSFQAFSGSKATDVVVEQATVNAASSGTTLQVGPNTAGAGNLVVSCMCPYAEATSLVINHDFTQQYVAYVNAVNLGLGFAHKIPARTQTVFPTWTQGSSQPHRIAAMAVFAKQLPQ